MIRKHFAKHGFNQEGSSHSYPVDQIVREAENKSAYVLFFFKTIFLIHIFLIHHIIATINYLTFAAEFLYVKYN